MRMTRFQYPGRFGAAFPPLSVVLSLLLWALATSAHAARPMITDDARIVDDKSCQLESWVKMNRGSTEYWAMPACNFSGNLEVTMGGSRTHDDAAGTFTSDQILQGKTLLKPLETNGWGAALTVGIDRHPQSGNGSDVYANVPLSFSFNDDKFVLHTNTGWLREQESKRDRLTWGLGSETQLTERTWLIAETFGQNQGKPSYQMGLRHWIVPNRIQIDTTYGNQFGSSTSQRWFSIGLRLLSLPFLP
ncbi:hypothetical protein [Herminiimonas arsenitoxidans]|uniref:hypothetical protein n=1 Tax=Herminiimonas arsenitoxidans TaxID=1809410 RepID=UPI0018D3FB24|nr:hypothetical protein [Herminiimonas arsenitoxidans]